jgi:hypothetical protein
MMMSNAIVCSQQGNFEFAFSLTMQFIDVCPEAIWKEKFGGWPVWQQLYHGISATDFFIRALDGRAVPDLCPAGASLHSAADCPAPAKADVREFAAKIKQAADDWIASLNDAALPKKHEGASSRMGRDCTNAGIMVLLTGHLLYHLGSCDAALRQHGLKGVF